MVKFVCDNPEIEQRLKALYEILKSQGTILHDSLVIECKEGDFSVTTSQKMLHRHELITLAQSCLIPVSKFHFSAEDDKILFEVSDPNVEDLHVKILTLVIEIYNLTEKLRRHRQSSIITMFYEDRNIFDMLMEDFSTPVPELAKTLSPQDVFCENFINVRGVFFKELSIEHIEDEQGKRVEFTKFLLPFVDYVNHHPHAFGISGHLIKRGGQGNVKIFATPKIESTGVYANYGLNDAHSILVRHGYADSNISMMRSVPIKFDVPNLGSFTINSRVDGITVTEFPKEIEDLKFYMPSIDIDETTKNVGISFAYIPSKAAPRSLRRILMLVFGQVESSEDKCWNAVLFAEGAIIRENMKYYKTLLDKLNNHPPSEESQSFIQNAKAMAQIQIDIMKNYPFFEEAMNEKAA